MSVELLFKDLQYVKGIGPQRAEILSRIGISTVMDLLEFFPRKYLDRSRIKIKHSPDTAGYFKIYPLFIAVEPFLLFGGGKSYKSTSGLNALMRCIISSFSSPRKFSL